MYNTPAFSKHSPPVGGSKRFVSCRRRKVSSAWTHSRWNWFQQWARVIAKTDFKTSVETSQCTLAALSTPLLLIFMFSILQTIRSFPIDYLTRYFWWSFWQMWRRWRDTVVVHLAILCRGWNILNNRELCCRSVWSFYGFYCILILQWLWVTIGIHCS